MKKVIIVIIILIFLVFLYFFLFKSSTPDDLKKDQDPNVKYDKDGNPINICDSSLTAYYQICEDDAAKCKTDWMTKCVTGCDAATYKTKYNNDLQTMIAIAQKCKTNIPNTGNTIAPPSVSKLGTLTLNKNIVSGQLEGFIQKADGQTKLTKQQVALIQAYARAFNEGEAATIPSNIVNMFGYSYRFSSSPRNSIITTPEVISEAPSILNGRHDDLDGLIYLTEVEDAAYSLGKDIVTQKMLGFKQLKWSEMTGKIFGIKLVPGHTEMLVKYSDLEAAARQTANVARYALSPGDQFTFGGYRYLVTDGLGSGAMGGGIMLKVIPIAKV